MKTDFKNLYDVLDTFKDEKVALEYLEHSRWNGNIICPTCGTDNPYKTATRSRRPELKGTHDFKCRNKDCHKKFTILSGTILENSKISLRNWLGAMYLCTNHKKGISSCQLARDLAITQKTAWFLLHRVREMLKEEAPIMLEGNVQVDESYFGGKAINKHRSKRAKIEKRERTLEGVKDSSKTAVIGLIETKGHVVAVPVPYASKKHIFPLIEKHAHKDAIMVTDDLGLYRKIPKQLGFEHQSVNHFKGQYKNGEFHTNSIEGFWSQLKRGIYGIYHQVSSKHLSRYCDEFAFRHNTRHSTDVNRFIGAISKIHGKRLTYNELINTLTFEEQYPMEPGVNEVFY